MIKIIEHLPLTIFVIVVMSLIDGINFNIILLCLLFGWLIDLDHLIDFILLNEKKNYFNLNLFFNGSYFQKSQKIYIFLHSYKITLALIYFSILYDKKIYYVALAHFFHLFQDQIFNNVRFFSYFFIYRLSNNFDIKKICN